MEEESCFRCERSRKEVKLLDAIYQNDMVKICERCALTEPVPIIKKPTTSQLRESEKRYTVYQRLKVLSGQKKEEKPTKSILDELRKLDEDPNLEKPEPEKESDLVDNFHWEITRNRRNKGLSQRQLAWALGESETAIKMLEKGELPEEPEKLIRKLEQFLQIKLRERTEQELEEEKRKLESREKFKIKHLEEPNSEETKEPIKPLISDLELEELDLVSTIASGKIAGENVKREDIEKTSPARILNFKPELMNKITISDLKQIKEEKEKEERLLEIEKERKKTLQKDNLIKEAGDEKKRKLEFKEKAGEEMKEVALGKNIKTIEEKRKMLNKAIDKINKEDEKVPTIQELSDKKRDKAREEERKAKEKEREIIDKVEREIPKPSLREKSAEEIIREAEKKQEEDAAIGSLVGNEIELEDED